MKTHPKSVPGKAPSGNNQRRRGVALLTVLTIVSLATILILTFFQLAQNEMVASDSYNNGLEAQQIAEQAVNMVIRQIRVATSGKGNAWASQPGAIRAWDPDGEFLAGYKLYSDDAMIVTSKEELVDPDYDEMINWDGEPWRFVDLNEPVVRGEKVYYPIVDPMATLTPVWNYELGEDDRGVEGFFIMSQDLGNRALKFLGSGSVADGPMQNALDKVTANDGLAWRTLPMPAQWIYQLKDGSLGYLNSSRQFTSVAGGSAPTEENPIVARFAFWTDDETAKLNPNVHAGGAAWATPMAGGDIDRNLGRFQPAQHEWQRYPGHPATTHIAPVLAPGIPDITYQRDNMEMIFGLVPRIVGGGSMSGTRKVNPNDPAERNGLIADKDRLYASLDEFLLEPGLQGSNPEMREPNVFPDPGQNFGGGRDAEEMQEHLERTKFFLTVTSKAPEVTLFNTPRISIWPTHWDGAPTHDDEEHWTPFDKLIRFCAELGGPVGERFKYHFQRYNADSATADIDDINRNDELLNYLDRLTSEKVPGFGKSFESKYGSLERRQILTEIFDYIRCVNLHDDSLYGEDWTDAFTGANFNKANFRTYTNGRVNDNNERSTHKGHGQVTPIIANIGSLPTKGLGRFYTLSEMGVVVIACADGGHPEEGDSYARGVGVGRVHNPGMTEYQRGFIEDPTPYYRYSNVPPLPSNMGPGDRHNINSYNSKWPQWLKDLAEKNPDGSVRTQGGQIVSRTGLEGEDLLDYCFDERNWNWQLAWLDSGYEGAMPSDKYKRNLISLSGSDKAHLDQGEKCVQAALVWNMFCPSLGWVPINPDMLIDIRVNGMTFDEVNGNSSAPSFGYNQSLGSSIPDNPSELAWATNRRQVTWHDRHYGGNKPMTYFMTASTNLDNQGLPARNLFFESGGAPGIGRNGKITPVDLGFGNVEQFDRYLYVTRPFRTDRRIKMNSGLVTMKIYSAGSNTTDMTERSAPQADAQLVQHIEIPFPAFDVKAPTLAGGRPGYINEFGAQQHGKTGPMDYWSLTRDGANPLTASRGRMSKVNGHHGGIFDGGDVVQSVAVRHGDMRVLAAQTRVEEAPDPNENLFQPTAGYDDVQMAHGFSTTPGWRFAGADLPLWRKGGTATRGVEERWLVHSDDGNFAYHRNRLPGTIPHDMSKDVQLYGDFDNGMGNSVDGPYINKPDEGNLHSLFNRTDPGATGLGLWEMARDYGDFPYFVRDWIHEAGTPSYFSPNRIISSPGQFGSLPVGTLTPWRDNAGNDHIGTPWRTLLFRPNVQGGQYPEDHPGSDELGDLPDHLFLDLFWMPVVEPFAISEPLSTAGKVNLNYQILPYHHIKRNTAIRGVFKSEYMVCIPNLHTEDYKIGAGRGMKYHWRDNPYGGTLQTKSLRTVILEDHTLYQFEEKFADREIFKTASEICDIHLVPEEISKRMNFGGSQASIRTTDFTKKSPEAAVAAMADGTYWSDHAAVGDNSRERPYSNIYARVTTKSNSYKVHYRAQVVKKAKGTDPGVWEPDLDQVVAEYRGSSIVERYVEPNDPDIPDYAGPGSESADTIDKFYKFRVVNPTRFAP